MNKEVDLATNATWFRTMPVYGKIMIGDEAYEFYNEKNVEDYVQIPWDQVTYVVADVHFKGKYIPRLKSEPRKMASSSLRLRTQRKPCGPSGSTFRRTTCGKPWELAARSSCSLPVTRRNK